MDNKSKREMNDYYSKLLDIHGASRKALGRGFEDSYQQDQKFALLAGNNKISSQASILDVGCGLGYLCEFFRAQGWQGSYTGVDINPMMIKAAKKRLPKEQFYCLDILTSQFDHNHDYVFCVATIQHKPRYSSEPDGYLKEMISKMFSFVNKALVFDVFSDRAEYYDEDNLYVNPVDLLSYCYSITDRLVFRNDYRAYQIMVYLYKELAVNDRNTYSDFDNPECRIVD